MTLMRGIKIGINPIDAAAKITIKYIAVKIPILIKSFPCNLFILKFLPT